MGCLGSPFFVDMQDSFDAERALQERIEQVVAARLPDADVLDVELDGGHGTVRVFLDHPGGVGLDLCAQVTQLLRDASVCDDRALEVSSPGIERPLRRASHYAAAIGEQVHVRRRGSRRASLRTIVAVTDDAVQLEHHDGVRETIRFGDIARARLDASKAVEAALAAKPRPGRRDGRPRRAGSTSGRKQ